MEDELQQGQRSRLVGHIRQQPVYQSGLKGHSGPSSRDFNGRTKLVVAERSDEDWIGDTKQLSQSRGAG